MKKLFVVRKFIIANSVEEVILKDKKAPIDEVWIHEEWIKGEMNKQDSAFAIVSEK